MSDFFKNNDDVEQGKKRAKKRSKTPDISSGIKKKKRRKNPPVRAGKPVTEKRPKEKTKIKSQVDRSATAKKGWETRRKRMAQGHQYKKPIRTGKKSTGTKRKSNLTPEQLSERAKKGWETRRKNQEEQKQKEQTKEKETTNTEKPENTTQQTEKPKRKSRTKRDKEKPKTEKPKVEEEEPQENELIIDAIKTLIYNSERPNVSQALLDIINRNIELWGIDDFSSSLQDHTVIFEYLAVILYDSLSKNTVNHNIEGAVLALNGGEFNPADIEAIRTAYAKDIDNELSRAYAYYSTLSEY